MAHDEFVTPDFTEPLDLEPLLKACTADHRLKGVFFDGSQKAATELGLHAPMKRYTAFREYPCAEYVQLVGGWVTQSRAPRPPRELLRQIGQSAFSAFRSTVVGKVIVAAAGDNVMDLMSVAGRGYAVSVTPGVLISTVEPGRAELKLRNITTFADCYHVGVFEGVLTSYGTPGTVRIRRHSLVNVDLLVEW